MNIVISGTTSGLGEHLANFFLSRQHNVFGFSRSSSTISHQNYTHVTVDFSKPDLLHSKITDQLTSVDMLINNAGIFDCGDFNKMDTDLIINMVNTNFTGVLLFTSFMIPLLSNSSHIFFINSVSGLHDIPQQSVYSSTKHALKTFASILGSELSPKTKVTSLFPGGMNTPLWDAYPEFHSNISELLDPQSISQLIDFLVSQPTNTIFKNIELFPDIEWH